MRILKNRAVQKQLGIISLNLLLFITNAFSQRTTITVSGIVTEEVSGKAVIGANVILYEDTISTKPLFGASTNRYGFYSIANVPRGTYLVVVRAIGYETFKRTYSLRDTSKSFRLNIKIKEESVLLKEVEVKGLRETESQAQVSAISIKPEILHQLPSMTGEVDLFRTLQLLPGVKTATELSTGLYVRGGSPDQTLTLLDGVIVYNPSHLGNFASTFNTDAIQDIRLIKGAFPAEYGGRLSSVLDIKLREGTKESVSGKVGLSMVSSNLMVEGPLSPKSTFMFSGRRMYYDFLQDRFYSTSTLPRYHFYDLNGKIHFSVSESDWLSFSGLLGADKIYSSKNSKDIEYDIKWSNQTFNFNWTHINSESMFSNTSLSYTNYFFDVFLSDKTKITSSKDYYSSSDLKDFSFRRETEYFPNEDHSIKFGTDVALHLYNLISSDVVLTEEEKEQGVGSEYLSLEAVLYAQDEWRIFPFLTTNIGGRVYYFKDRKSFRFEPRVSLS
ncbi:MAG: TonB-dependent receptor, partial [Ignavibacteria bacterium]|nr:TonB-dependent receptor [Ignavibacteria bacterium]